MEVEGKRISELRVVDLRHVLEKRGLEKSGNKSVLIDRLIKVNSKTRRNRVEEFYLN